MVSFVILCILAIAASIAAMVAGLIAVRSFRRANLLRCDHDRLNLRVKELGNELAALDRLASCERAQRLTGSADIACLSQHGEDAWLWRQFDFKLNGFFIEIGAHDGRTFSNSFFFERLGWKGVLVEANPVLVARCEENRPRARVVHAAVVADIATHELAFSTPTGADGVSLLGFSEHDPAHVDRIHREGGTIETVKVPAKTLDTILESGNSLDKVDFVSIDIEGAELSCLQGFDLDRWQPRILLIEDNSGGADQSVVNHLNARGYSQIKTIGCNLVFARIVD